MSDEKKTKSPSDAYAEWLENEAKESPPLDANAVDPDEDDSDDIDDEDDTEAEPDSESEDSAPTGATTAQAQAEAAQPLVTNEHGEVPMKMSEIRSGLKTVAEDENAPDEDRAAARKALSAMDEEPKAEDTEPVEEPKSEEEPAPAPDEPTEEEPKDKPAEATDDEDEDDAPKPGAKGKAASALALAARVQELEARESKRAAKAERAKLMASRPDFAEATVAWLSGQKLAVVRDACRAPKSGGLPLGSGKGGQVAAARAAAAAAGVPTAGANDPQTPPPTSPSGRTNYSGEGERMDQLMGLTRTLPSVESQSDGPGTIVVMRATKRADAVRQNAARNGVK